MPIGLPPSSNSRKMPVSAKSADQTNRRHVTPGQDQNRAFQLPARHVELGGNWVRDADRGPSNRLNRAGANHWLNRHPELSSPWLGVALLLLARNS